MKETVNRVTPERTEGVAAVIVRVECAPDPARLPCRSSARPKDTRIRPTTSRRVRTRFASVSTTLHRGSFLSFAAKPQTVKAPMESPRSSPATAISATAPWRRAWAVLMSKEGVLMRPLPLPEDWLVAEFWEHCNLGELPLKRRSECRTGGTAAIRLRRVRLRSMDLGIVRRAWPCSLLNDYPISRSWAAFPRPSRAHSSSRWTRTCVW
jgi:hypothetical protein